MVVIEIPGSARARIMGSTKRVVVRCCFVYWGGLCAREVYIPRKWQECWLNDSGREIELGLVGRR